MTQEWHSRGYIRHWEAGETPQAITFRLADSLPSALLEQWRDELCHLPDDEFALKRRARIEKALDLNQGAGDLARSEIAELVENALLHFDASRYRLHAWCIMPNHVHTLLTPMVGHTLSQITHSWKSFTARKANELLKRTKTFWAPEYFDRAIRDEAHYENTVVYIAANPV
ncbi:MAG: transposase [Alphaproteobacteria bacterium]|nr:transposase [Alphaproteobacteria bacterium]